MDIVRGGSRPFSGNKRRINVESGIDRLQRETLENARNLLEKMKKYVTVNPNQDEVDALRTLIEFHS